ncbi:MAG: FHA domain-containing protein [Bacteroidales bacterium]|nr:FHA domain-containing protein [Bacteroidales bacterium]
MSGSKTVFPGMEDAYSASNNNFNNQGANMGGPGFPNFDAPNAQQNVNNKPIVGFLYSISKTNVGEYWPLRIGSNSIGRSQDCDICLSEATVSAQHAVLVVRQMKNPDKIIASICDARSTCGTMINGSSLGFEPKECFNGDVITIGEHYEFYFILIDAKQIGLSVCAEFSPAEVQMDSPYSKNFGGDNIPRTDGGTMGFGDANLKSAYSDNGRGNKSGTMFI